MILFVLTSFIGQNRGDNNKIYPDEKPYSPAFISMLENDDDLLILEATAKRLDKLHLSSGEVKKGAGFDGLPTGFFVGDKYIYVTTDEDNGKVEVLDHFSLDKISSFDAGPGARSPQLIKSKGILTVCHTWLDELGIYSIDGGELLKTVPVLKQPFTSVVSEDEKYLFVSNFTTHQAANKDTVSSAVSVINLESYEVERHILLANGSNALRGMALSSDGEYVLISHNLGRFQVPTTQLEQGWMNTSALSIIRVADLSYQATILLDEPEYGAAGSWGIDCFEGQMAVAHSGTHDFSLIDEKAFFEKLDRIENKEALAYDLNFLSGIRKRIKLPGNGPRAVDLCSKGAFLAMYFSDTINQVNIDTDDFEILSFGLNQGFHESPERLGEKYFNDAALCFQGWQSCNGCHPNNARTDGLNWDLLNDGMGNPRNCKSMLLSHETPPVMITGIRADAETAVRAGFKYIQFARVSEEHAEAVDAYLKSLKPVPSPFLIDGELSSQGKRGKEVYNKLGCQNCHQAPFYTDMEMYTFTSPNDTLGPQAFDTPTLVEVWRTGPWMHDGRCATMEEVFAKEKHGVDVELKEDELNDLVKYVLSL